LAISFLGADVDARFNKLRHQLVCMCGCNQLLLECNHVGCGYEYSNTVLSAPTSSGLNVIAWIMPFAVFALATTIALWLVRSRKEAFGCADGNDAHVEYRGV
jgi:cytochrome c-type biogenesis protein CcmH